MPSTEPIQKKESGEKNAERNPEVKIGGDSVKNISSRRGVVEHFSFIECVRRASTDRQQGSGKSNRPFYTPRRPVAWRRPAFAFPKAIG
jgi:hypothetical protein